MIKAEVFAWVFPVLGRIKPAPILGNRLMVGQHVLGVCIAVRVRVPQPISYPQSVFQSPCIARCIPYNTEVLEWIAFIK